jgi:hypothetical protein
MDTHSNKLNVSGAAILSGAVLISGSYNTHMPPSPIIIKIPRQELEAVVTFWTEIVGAHIIEYDSIKKETFHKQWSTEDDTNINYKANLQAGLYDKGFAVRTGKLNRGPYKDYYLISIDYDTLEAFLAWCGEDYNLEILAKWTRVEWHKNPAKIHAFFISKTPLRDFARSKDNQIIEVYGEKPHLVCVYGNHKDGNPIGPYDIEEIAVIDNVTKLEIENRIKQVIPSYLDNDAVNSYVEELEKPDSKVPKGSVHIAVRTMLMSVYFRWKGKFADMSDEQKFQYVVDWDRKKAKQAGRPAYIDVSPGKLEELWEGIRRKYQGQRQKERDEREERKNNTFSEMPGCISYEISPGRFIVGTPDYKVAEITRKFTPHETIANKVITTITHVKTFTACKPVKVIKHVNPLSFLETQDKFTIEFKGLEASGCFTAKHKTLSEIVSLLKNGNALIDRGIQIALQAQIKGFERAGLLEVNDSMDYTGFFPSFQDGNKTIISSNIKIPENYPDVTDALNFIDELQKWYKGREDLLAHILLWPMIAPFSFIFKVVNAPLLEWMHLHGNPNAGKTSSGLIGLAFDGNENNEDFVLNMRYIDTHARFGDTISNTTFPKIINEVDLTDRPDIVNNIVMAVDAVKFRKVLDRNRIVEHCPGLTPLFLTGNPSPSTRPEYLKRVRTRNFPIGEVHSQTSTEAVEYKKWLAANMRRCRPLGLARNKLVTESKQCQEIILDTNLIPFEKSRKIWNAIYKSADRELPSLFNKNLEETQMADSIEDRKTDVLNALEGWIIDRCRSLNIDDVGGKKILDQYKDSIHRLTQLVDRKLVSCVKRDRDQKIIFFRQITVELERFGAKQLDLPSLADAIPGAVYGKLSHGYKVVKCSVESLTAFFDGAPSDE